VSSVDVTAANFPYAGWIPTANGRLSFRHIGESRNPTESFYANVTVESRRIILAFQRRNLSDLLFQTVIHYLVGIEDRFFFVIAATSEGNPAYTDEITGKIYIYKSKDDWKTKARAVLSRTIKSINAYRLSVTIDRDRRIEDDFAEANRTLDGTCDVHISFVLQRTGDVFFSKPVFLDRELEYASVQYASELNQDFAKWIADQCYFFLRDLTHMHQHHSPSSDTILILQRNDDEGIEWRRNVIFSLHHYIIRAKRYADASSLYQAAGILAYCNSFQRICLRHLGDNAKRIPPFNVATLLQSLSARASEESQKAAERGVRSILRSTWRASGIAILAAFIAIIAMLAQPQIEKGRIPELTQLSGIVGRHIVGIFIWIIALFLAFWIVTSDVMTRWAFGKDVLEAANVKRKNAIVVFTVLSLATLAVASWIGFAALQDFWRSLVELWKALG
jgi:hypothetical protein